MFRRNSSSWDLASQFRLPGATSGTAFGSSVAFSADCNILAVGASGYSESPALPAGGAAFLVDLDPVTMSPTLMTLVKMPDAQRFARFGASVALRSESEMAVGAPGLDVVSQGQGGVYIFERKGTPPPVPRKLLRGSGASNLWVPKDPFPDRAKVTPAVPPLNSTAAIPVDVISGGGWQVVRRLVVPGAAFMDNFGSSLAWVGQTLAVGAPSARRNISAAASDEDGPVLGVGSAFVYFPFHSFDPGNTNLSWSVEGATTTR